MTETTSKKVNEIVQQSYHAIAEAFSETRGEVWTEVRKLAEQYVQKGDRVLDIGCGNGRLLDALKNQRVQYTGMDQALRFIEICRERYGADDMAHDFLQGNALDLPFDNNSFDVVFLIAVLNHFSQRRDQLRVLEEARRVLKQGGTLIMTNWNLWRLSLKKTVWGFFVERLLCSEQQFRAKYGFEKRNFFYRDVLTVWKRGETQGILYYYAFTPKELHSLTSLTGFQETSSYYEYQGKQASMWKARNLVMIGKKPSI